MGYEGFRLFVQSKHVVIVCREWSVMYFRKLLIETLWLPSILSNFPLIIEESSPILWSLAGCAARFMHIERALLGFDCRKRGKRHFVA